MHLTWHPLRTAWLRLRSLACLSRPRSLHPCQPLRSGAKSEDGFTLIAVLGVLLAGSALSVATYTAARGDIHLSRNDQDQKRAYAAAEAGIQDYFFHLTQDNAYWSKCASPTPAHPALNLAGASPLRTRRVPSSAARYAIELLPANGEPACSTRDAAGTMIVEEGGPMSGTFSVKATGFSNGVDRSIVATFRRRSFLDYLWFTDLETSDPAWYALETRGFATQSGTYVSRTGIDTIRPSGAPDLMSWAARQCPRYWRNGRRDQRWPVSPDDAWQQQAAGGSWETQNPFRTTVRCTEIQFVGADSVRGPLHTNDDLLVCNSPTFGRRDKADSIEVSGSGWRQAGGCSGTPTFNGVFKPFSPVLTPPPSSNSLKQIVSSRYLFRGRTRIVLSGASIIVSNPNISPTTQTLAVPENGVVYVDYASNCTATAYEPLRPYDNEVGCAVAYVGGSYSEDLTIASAKDIVVESNVRAVTGSDSMLGLIADNFVRVYHPVVSSRTDPTQCTNATTTPRDIWIDAAILALNHSFTVDHYYCGGDDLGTLTVFGAIAQKHRGPVGRSTGGGVSSGYLKDYNYDERLRLREPPHFIDPVQASWRIQRYAEQVG